MADIVHLPSDTSATAFSDVIARDGVVIADDFLTPSLLAQLQSELGTLFMTAKPGKDDFTGYKTQRIGALIARSVACREIAVNPLLLALADALLSPFSLGFQLHLTQATRVGSGETSQILHRDRGLWGGFIPRRIETQLGTLLAVDEFTRSNGATQVVPGSQNWDADREPKEDEIARAEMSAGSILLYTGTVLHGAGANGTDKPRIGLLIHYALNWLRQQENQYLSCPVETAATLPSKLRKLIGYAQGGPVIGFFSSPTGAEGLELSPPEALFGDQKGTHAQIKSAADIIKKSS